MAVSPATTSGKIWMCTRDQLQNCNHPTVTVEQASTADLWLLLLLVTFNSNNLLNLDEDLL